MFSQYTKLGKLKTHGEYIVMYSENIEFLLYTYNVLTICFQFLKLGIL